MTDLLAVTYAEVDKLTASAVAQARICLAHLEDEILPRLQSADRSDAQLFISSVRQNRLFTARAAVVLDRLLYATADRIDETAPDPRNDGAGTSLALAQRRLLGLRNTLETISCLMRTRSSSGLFRATA